MAYKKLIDCNVFEFFYYGSQDNDSFRKCSMEHKKIYLNK